MTRRTKPRPSRRNRGYGPAWQRLREQAKATYPPVCWLCHRPINLNLSGSHKYGWTLDHLDPIALYGPALPPLHRVRPAHRTCNVTRGNLARIGIHTSTRATPAAPGDTTGGGWL